MPNTLVHLGVQGLVLRSIASDRYLAWVAVGCVLPDLPWILQRVCKRLQIPVDPFDLRVYCIVQASLFMCLLLSAGVAQLTRDRWKIFQILALSSLVHLLLDATEIKWGNGVHLLAPFSWRLVRFDLFWPESAIVSAVTLAGLVLSGWLIVKWWRVRPHDLQLRLPDAQRWMLGGGAAASYVLLPLALMSAPEQAGNHSVGAFRARWTQSNLAVEMYRAHYIVDEQGHGALWTMDDRPLEVLGLDLPSSARVSIRGVLLDGETIRVDEWHRHAPARDVATAVGLLLVSMLVLASARPRSPTDQRSSPASTRAPQPR